MNGLNNINKLNKPMAQQTAVEWLFEQYKKHGYLGYQDEEQAKEMERDQHESTCVEVIERILDKLEKGENTNSEEVFNQYYNETYGK